MFVFKRNKIEIIEKLVVITYLLQNDIYNEFLQGKVNRPRDKMKAIEKHNARWATTTS